MSGWERYGRLLAGVVGTMLVLIVLAVLIEGVVWLGQRAF
jgi:hypothetical protein